MFVNDKNREIKNLERGLSCPLNLAGIGYGCDQRNKPQEYRYT